MASPSPLRALVFVRTMIALLMASYGLWLAWPWSCFLPRAMQEGIPTGSWLLGSWPNLDQTVGPVGFQSRRNVGGTQSRQIAPPHQCVLYQLYRVDWRRIVQQKTLLSRDRQLAANAALHPFLPLDYLSLAASIRL